LKSEERNSQVNDVIEEKLIENDLPSVEDAHQANEVMIPEIH
jgi:hypothetical protein